jgi:hypothetical protein
LGRRHCLCFPGEGKDHLRGTSASRSLPNKGLQRVALRATAEAQIVGQAKQKQSSHLDALL